MEMNYFEVVPKEIIIEIIQFLDSGSKDTLSKSFDRVLDIVKDNNTWNWILYNNYPKLYQALSDIQLMSGAEVLYFSYKDNIDHTKDLLDFDIYEDIAMGFLIEYNDIIQKVFIYINFPNIYHRLLQIIEHGNLTPLGGGSNFKKVIYSLRCSILDSTFNKNFIKDYFTTGRYNYEMTMQDIHALLSGRSGDSNIYMFDDIILLYLLCTDDYIDINNEIQIEELTSYLFSIDRCTDFRLIKKLNRHNLNLLCHMVEIPENSSIDTIIDSFYLFQ